MRRAAFFLTIAALGSINLVALELKLPPELQPIMDLSASVPPEFAAQALLRMVSSGRIKDKPARRELCIRAFETAVNAHEPLMRRAIAGVTGDSVAGALDQSYRLKLDKIGLQSKAVLLLLRDDKSKARELFEQIPRPTVPSLSCADALVYDVSDYVDALQAVEEQSFTDAERKKEDQVSFLLTYLSGITSPSELAPAARLVTSAGGVTNSERDLLVARFNGIMEGIETDPRAYATSAPDIRAAISPAMLASFGKLADRMKAAPACGSASAGAQPFWQSTGSKDMLSNAKKVRFGDDKKTWTDADRETPEWRDQFNNFTAAVESWNPDPGETTAVFFHERVIIYEGLMDVAPTADARQRMLEDFMGFLNASPLQRDNPPEWFSVVPAMWHRIPFRQPGEQEALAETLTHSGNPVVSLYLMLEKTIPQTPGGQH